MGAIYENGELRPFSSRRPDCLADMGDDYSKISGLVWEIDPCHMTLQEARAVVFEMHNAYKMALDKANSPRAK